MSESPSAPDRPEPGPRDSVWRFAHASRAHLVIDAADYFDLAREAMLRAEASIILISWDFDTRIRLAGGRRWWDGHRRHRYPARLGAFIVWLVRRTPTLKVHVLLWNLGAAKFLRRGTMLADLVRWWWNRDVVARFDAAHPIACCHHQKILVIDDKVAACGGIDMTGARWDTREHRDRDHRRRRPSGRRYGPWHDVTMLLEGEVAGALADLGRERWQRATGRTLTRRDAHGSSPWPERLAADFTDVEVGIARTSPEWHGSVEVREVEALFLEHIARAKRFVYAETQYFASRRIAEAIARRLVEDDPPEFVILNPVTADGWLQQLAMDGARVRLLHALARLDTRRRFHLYVPHTRGGEPIYVHAKLTIVDDEVLRVGSANMNNRSMGLDSECDVFLDTRRAANAAIGPTITQLRHSLLAEHCGLSPKAVAAALAAHGESMAAMIDACPRTGRGLRRFELRDLTDTEKAIADDELLDPDRPDEVFAPIDRRRGLFRRGGLLRGALSGRVAARLRRRSGRRRDKKQGNDKKEGRIDEQPDRSR